MDADSALEAGTALPPEPSQNSSGKPLMTFQERVALERQQKDDAQSPG
jgi:hypothetical protein